MHEEVLYQNFVCLLNNCFSNLAILYGLCILDISFLYLLWGVSDKHCLVSFFFFSFDSVCEDILPINFACPKGK